MEKPQRAVMPVHSTIWVTVTGTARGVKTDKSRAIELFKQSADNGNAKAAQMLKILSQHLFMK